MGKPPTKRSEEQLTRERLMRLVANRVGAQLPIHLLACAVVVPVLWSHVSPGRLLLFSGIVAALAILQTSLTRRAATHDGDDGLTAEICMLGSAMLGLCWGMAYFGFVDTIDPVRRALLLVVLATLGLAAVPILSGLAGAANTFALSLFAPVIAWHLSRGDQAELHLALAAAIFPAALVLVMGRVRGTARRGMLLQAEKEQLTDTLNREILEHRRHERYYRSLLENSSDLITVRGPNGETLYESPSAVALVGEDCPSVRFALDRVHADDRDALEDAHTTMSESGTDESKSVEFRLKDKLRKLAVTDGLTGLMNRRRLDEVLGAEWARARRHATTVSLLMIDIDHFKAFNDHYGHPEGDAVLARLASVLRTAVQRPGDAVARYGGEEFTVVLPHTHGPGAASIAGRIRDLLAEQAIVHLASPVSEHVTLSIGVATMTPTPDQPASVLIAAADEALYDAKNAGRDTISTAVIVDPGQRRCSTRRDGLAVRRPRLTPTYSRSRSILRSSIRCPSSAEIIRRANSSIITLLPSVSSSSWVYFSIARDSCE
jgi:diguanylate cyclase (GGDEF)-like protein